MADALNFYRTLNSQINQLVTTLQLLETSQDRMTADSGLASAAAAAAAAIGRTDLVTIDFTNAANAIGQLLFTFNSGAPTQKSYLYKIL